MAFQMGFGSRARALNVLANPRAPLNLCNSATACDLSIDVTKAVLPDCTACRSSRKAVSLTENDVSIDQWSRWMENRDCASAGKLDRE